MRKRTFAVFFVAVSTNSNLPALRAQRRLSEASGTLSKAYERLSSGLRINKASDDAAGLSISSQLNASARVLSQALRNVNDGISLASIAEGALSQMKEITYRQRELATQAANGPYTIEQRQAMNAEANKLVEEYNRIVESTDFNGTKLFSDDPKGIRIQAGQGTESSLVLNLAESLSRNVGDGTFQAPQTLAEGVAPQAVAIRDFNRDGKDDVIMINAQQDSANVLLGNGDGTFQEWQAFGTGDDPLSVVIGDLNGDGKEDLVTADLSDDTLSVLFGNGDGTFQARQVFSTGDMPRSLVMSDLDGDGNEDLAFFDGPDKTVSVLLGNGDGTFQARRTFETGDDALGLVAGDVNGDGRVDLSFITNGDYDPYSYNYIRCAGILLGNGDGTFQARQTFDLANSSSPSFVSIGDVNGDGRADIVTGDYSTKEIGVLLGNSDGSVQAKQTLSAYEGAGLTSLAIGDINGDGKEDIVSGSYGFTASVFLGNGDGTFQHAQVTTTAWNVNSIAIGDVSGDGRADLVTTGWYFGEVSVLLANGPRTSAVPYLNLNTRQKALEAISVIDGNLGRIESELGAIGASTSRFSVALNMLQATRENELAAFSRITDADIADETAQMTKAQILRDMAAAVLGQANQGPQPALTLLKGSFEKTG